MGMFDFMKAVTGGVGNILRKNISGLDEAMTAANNPALWAQRNYRQEGYQSPHLERRQVDAARDALQYAQPAIDSKPVVKSGSNDYTKEFQKALEEMKETLEVAVKPDATIQDVQDSGYDFWERLQNILREEGVEGGAVYGDKFDESDPVAIFGLVFATFKDEMSR